jgi:O-methyltransferase involved in polyketide biosynthesis
MAGWDAAAAGIDVTVPNVARMYDYALGGKENYAADREAVHELIRLNPVHTFAAREIRAFLGRVVRAAAGAGIRQFLDLGSGLPTQQNVHQIARELAPDTRVVYCDYDPVVVAHTRALLAGQDNAWIIEQDIRRPRQILRDPVVRSVLDLREPAAVLLIAVLHFIPDADHPDRIVRELAQALAPGSWVAIAHVTPEWHPDRKEQFARARQVYDQSSASLTPRESGKVSRWVDGTDLAEPGAVPVGAWRPASPGDAAGAERTAMFGLVAVKRSGQAAGGG